MKKTVLLLFVGFLSFGVSAQSFGLKGGMVMATMGGDDIEDAKMIFAPLFGGFMQFGDGPIKFTTEFGYVRKGAKSEYTIDDYDGLGNAAEITNTVKIDYLEIGVNGNFHITDEFSINVGPYLGINLGDKLEVEMKYLGNTASDKGDADAESIDFGANFGFSFWVNDMFLIDARYGLGLTELDDNTEVFNRTIQLGVGYLFSY